jgi:polysaccharide biosynthesis transport protein
VETADQPTGEPGGLPVGSEPAKLDIRAYWRVVRKRWPILLVSTVLAVAITLVYTFRLQKIYEATCQIVIETMTPQVLQVKDVVELGTGTYWANKEFYETQYRIIQSSAVAQRVADKLGLRTDPDFKAAAESGDPMGVARTLLGRVRVQGVKDSRIGSIVVSDTKPERAALIANAFADTYVEYNLDYKLEGAKTANSWLGEQEVDLKRKLRDSELALYDFRKDRNLLAVSLNDKQSMTTETLQNVGAALARIRLKRIELEAGRKIIQGLQSNPEASTDSVPEVQENEFVMTLRNAYVHVVKQKAELATRYGVEHPKIREVDGMIAAAHSAYRKEIDNLLASMDNRYRSIVEQEKALAKEMESQKQEAIELSKLEVEYKPLSRTAEENLKLYQLISSRQREIDLTGLLRTNNVRVLERAVAPGAPVRPQPLQNLGIGLLVGLGLGIGLAYLIEALDNTLKTPNEVEALLAVPVLGLIPVIGAKDEKGGASRARERDLGIFLDPKSLAAECCRSIRTNILFMSPDHPPRTIVVTSPSPQEGKTTTAANLAVTLAESGARVLVIDTDMRRPRLHQSFGVPNQSGVSTAIVGNSTLDEVIKRTEVPNLDVLPCGPVPPNPSELLHTARFAQLVRECASRYDRVVLDSPPTSAVTDPAVLGNLCDGVLLIVKGGQTTRESAVLARRQLHSANAKLLGVIINEVDFSNAAYGYQYYYHRGYARYGYAYGGGGSGDDRGAAT